MTLLHAASKADVLYQIPTSPRMTQRDSSASSALLEVFPQKQRGSVQFAGGGSSGTCSGSSSDSGSGTLAVVVEVVAAAPAIEEVAQYH